MSTDLQGKLRSRLQADKYPGYIKHIRFPRYRNLSANLHISFTFPVTALVGANGSNKSSILRALQGAPFGRSVGNYWFSTDVDVIDGFRKSRSRDPQRFIYGFRVSVKGESILAECRKSRVARRYRVADAPPFFKERLDPDYWEPTKIATTDGMALLPEHLNLTGLASADRWAQLRKPVVYLDFRSELSAFDKYFYHSAFNKWAPDETMKKMRIIQKSEGLARALASSGPLPAGIASKVVEPRRDLSQTVVDSVSKILGRTYTKITVIRHKFFGAEGNTVKLHIGDDAYSEAHAGSGEFAVVRLVEEIVGAERGSLILLDEPEVSLHPGSQRALVQFLLEASLAHGHQVVISTHSSTVVESLPDDAIKLLTYNSESQSVELQSQSTAAYNAFFSLGHSFGGSRRKIFVEDELVTEIVKFTLRQIGAAALAAVDVIAFPGGVDGLKKTFLPMCALANLSDTPILLDGDARPSKSLKLVDLDKIAAVPANLASLERAATDEIGLIPDLHANGSGGVASEQSKAEHLMRILTWSRHSLRFLPGRVPEALVLNLLEAADINMATSGAKKLFMSRARAEFGKHEAETLSKSEFRAYQATVIAKLDPNLPALVQIREIVEAHLAAVI